MGMQVDKAKFTQENDRVKAKAGKPDAFGPLRYFAEKLGVKEKYMVCLDDKHDYIDRASGTTVIPAAKFFVALV